jgi:hypothetical protein
MIRAAANVGYLVRTNEARVRDTRLGSSVLYGLGVGVHPITPLEINLEFHGQSYGGRASQNPAELLVGAKIFAGEVVVVNVGGGLGLLSGVGSPDARVYAGLQFVPNFDPAMRDGTPVAARIRMPFSFVAPVEPEPPVPEPPPPPQSPLGMPESTQLSISAIAASGTRAAGAGGMGAAPSFMRSTDWLA